MSTFQNQNQEQVTKQQREKELAENFVPDFSLVQGVRKEEVDEQRI